MGRIENLPTMRLVAARLAPARRVVTPLRARLKAHPRAAGIAIAALLLVALTVPLLVALGQPNPSQSLALQPGTDHTPTSMPTHAPSPTATAGKTPSATPSLDWASAWRSIAESAYVDGLISHMTLDDELGQMMMISVSGTTVDSGIAGLITQYHPGSVIMWADSINGAGQITKMNHDMQALSPIPLLISTDVEGLGVNRLAGIGVNIPSAPEMSAQGAAYVRQQGQLVGNDMAKYGFNVDLAPVVDVLTNPGSIVAGRSFGSTPSAVTQMAGAFLRGLQENHRVIGTLKHFPGLGDVTTDPHYQIATLSRGLGDLKNIDWAPYKALIATGQVDMVMSTHVYVPAVDPTVPATLSYPLLTGVLRNQLGFQGVIITDAVYMDGLWKNLHYSNFGPIYVKAVQAGNDIICSVGSFGEAQLFMQSLHDAIKNGTITKRRIDDSVRRILMLKLRYGVLAMAPRHS